MTDPLTRRSDDPLTTPDPAATSDATGLREASYTLACGHTVMVPHGGAAKCEPCAALAEYLTRQVERSEAVEALAVHPDPTPECHCPPCPGRGNDGHGLTHCAECCFGTGVEAEPGCPVHHPTPDASPDPAVVQVLAAHQYLPNPKSLVGKCTAHGCDWQHFDSCEGDHRAHVADALAAAGFGDVRAIEAERDRASAGRDLWRQSHALMRQRAEAAEKELADLRERVEAVKPVTLSHGWAGYRSEFVPLTELRAALNPGAGACTCGAAEHGAMAQHLRPCPEAGA